MKKLLLTTVLAVATIGAMANPIGRTAAMQKAQDFMRGINPQAQLQAGATPRKAMGNNNSAPYYIFNAENNKGFVIVSGDDRSEEILGYADEGSLDPDNLPDGLQFLLEDFTDQLANLDAAGITKPASTASRGPRKVMSTSRHPVKPLTTSKWGQTSPYWDLLPTMTAGDEMGRRPYTGCGQTATAQMLYYWKYAHMEYDIPSYTLNTSAYAEPVTMESCPKMEWDFNQLKDEYSGSNQYISKFLKYIFTANQARAYATGTNTDHDKVKARIGKYFNYTMNHVWRDDAKPTDFEEFVYNDLRQGLPVMFYGESNVQGQYHYFIADGYSHDSFFHFNWGWNGRQNGYFHLSPLSAYNYATAHLWAKKMVGFFGFRPNDGRVMPTTQEPYKSYQTAETFSADIRTLYFYDGSTNEDGSVKVVYSDQVGTQRADGTFDFGIVQLRTYLENRTDLEGATANFDVEFVILDNNDNFVGTFGSQTVAIGANSMKVVTYDPNKLKLPSGDGEYYLVHRSKSKNSEYGIFHYSEIKGVNSHYKAVVKNGKLTISVVKALEYDLSKTELTGQCATDWRTNVRFYAKNNSYTNMKVNYTLCIDKATDDANCMQDNKELNIPARSEGYIDLNFMPGTKNGKLLLVNKDRQTYSSDYIDATYPFTLKTAVTPNLSCNWVAENLSSWYVYGKELNGYVSITNNSDTDYEDVFTLRCTYSNNAACGVTPLKIPAGKTVNLNFDCLDYSDIFDVYGNGASGKSVTLYLYNGLGINSTKVGSKSFSLTSAPITWWDKNGRAHAVESLNNNKVPEDAVAINFSSSVPRTITPNDNPNCLYYYPSSSYSSYYRTLVNNNKNVIAGSSAVTSIKFTDEGRIYVPQTFTAANVSYTRTFDYGYENSADKQGWTSICLPFTVEKIMNKAQNKEIDFFRSASDKGKNFWLRKLVGEEFNTVYFDCASEFEANVPYLIRMPGAYYQEFDEENCLIGKEIVFSAQNASVVSGMANEDCTSYNFISTESAGKYNSDYYVYGSNTPGNVFTYLSSTVKNCNDLMPFRGYLTREYVPIGDAQHQVKIVQVTPLNTYDYAGNPENIVHRFPAIKFTYGDLNYEVPAWDELVESEAAHTRLQALREITNNKINVPARTVTNRAWSIDSSEPVFEAFEDGTENITIGNTSKSVSTLTYGEACDLLNLTIANADRSVKVFDFTPVTATELSVPAQLNVTTGVNAGHTFTVNEIGAATYCNNPALKAVNIPVSVTGIKASAFNGCPMLNKVTFESAEPVSVEGDPFAGVTKDKCAIYVPSNIVKAYRESNELWNEFIFAVPVSNVNKFGTFSSNVPFTTRKFSGSRWMDPTTFMMYWIDVNKNTSPTTLTMSPTRDRETNLVPAGFGLVMKTSSDGGSGYVFMPPVGANEKSDLIADNNRLKAVSVDTYMGEIIKNTQYRYYVLQSNVFKKVEGNNLVKAGRAYLEMPASIFSNNDAKLTFTCEDDETDGILLINGDEQNASNIYDIQGRKVERTSKGIYIVNGKKVVVK